MTLFWLCALLMALLVAFLLAAPLLGPLRDDERSLISLNVQVFRERLAELEKDRAEGRVDDETFAGLKTGLRGTDRAVGEKSIHGGLICSRVAGSRHRKPARVGSSLDRSNFRLFNPYPLT